MKRAACCNGIGLIAAIQHRTIVPLSGRGLRERVESCRL